MGFIRGFKAKANRIAVKIREQMGLADVAPIDPEAICDRFDIQLIKLSEIAPSCDFLGANKSAFSAVTVPRGHQIAIVHNDFHHPYRQRSNICHELGHCFLGHECTPPLTEEGERASNGGIEAEANFLAGTLLITNEAAFHILQSGILNQAQDLYGVSGPMLNYRLKVSGAYTRFQRSLKLAKNISRPSR